MPIFCQVILYPLQVSSLVCSDLAHSLLNHNVSLTDILYVSAQRFERLSLGNDVPSITIPATSDQPRCVLFAKPTFPCASLSRNENHWMVPLRPASAIALCLQLRKKVLIRPQFTCPQTHSHHFVDVGSRPPNMIRGVITDSRNCGVF